MDLIHLCMGEHDTIKRLESLDPKLIVTLFIVQAWLTHKHSRVIAYIGHFTWIVLDKCTPACCARRKKITFHLNYRRYTDTAIIRTLIRQLSTIDHTLKEFIFSK